ncbi:putative rhamnosyl transferase [Paenibacillus sp. J5C_2022]|uniref:putative rhamnosyl transferase n=1 Tax=Paenibacillus sp. J5C2022 TaxID=2977129 RepID=UPI0021CF1E67|nr:putative rhamnosyl transferase [Paenibacillus sp. J5C2022]MCU6710422.1 putative rhamnosyl transferase [Paenibacillus sp. J5C2022]
MKDVNMIVDIQFNSLEYSKQIYQKSWIDYRMAISMKYTIPCLKGQTMSDFTVYFYYKDETEPLIREALSDYEPLPPHIQFVPYSTRQELQNEAARGADKLYIVRLDSDNMLRKDFFQRVRSAKLEYDTKAIITQHGYLYDSNKHRMAIVSYHSPSFYTLVYRSADYLSGVRHALKKHHDAIKHKHVLLQDRNFVVVVHGTNVLNRFKVNRASELIGQSEIQEILERFC